MTTMDKKMHKKTKHKKICNPLDEVPITRPGLDHEIDLGPNFKYQSTRTYKLSKPKVEELKKQLGVFLSKGWIKELQLPSKRYFYFHLITRSFRCGV